MRVALFATCLVDAAAPNVGQATVAILRRLGVEVHVPWQQTCCGQMHINSGYPDKAMPLIANHVATFGSFDAIVVPSGSCAGSARHQHASVARDHSDGGLERAATELAARTYELSEFLVDVLGVDDVGAYFPHRVTYHPTCHGLRMLRLGDRPLRLLRNVEGLELLELPNADVCCGFGGTFALKNSAVSTAMLDDKVAAIKETGAQYCAAGDASCLMHIGGGLSRTVGDSVRPIHLAEILAATR